MIVQLSVKLVNEYFWSNENKTSEITHLCLITVVTILHRIGSQMEDIRNSIILIEIVGMIINNWYEYVQTIISDRMLRYITAM